MLPIRKPDSSKLLRAVEDSLTGLIYVDDARIVEHHVRKRFAIDSPPRAEILVAPFVDETIQQKAATDSQYAIAYAILRLAQTHYDAEDWARKHRGVTRNDGQADSGEDVSNRAEHPLTKAPADHQQNHGQHGKIL